MRFIFLLIILAISWTSCTDSGDHESISELKYADSIELRIIKDHDRPDSDEITRIRNASAIQIIAATVNGKPAASNNCDIEGKMYFFRGENVFKTVYFSLHDDCRFFAYVVNGKKHFVVMKEDALIYMKKLIAKSFSKNENAKSF